MNKITRSTRPDRVKAIVVVVVVYRTRIKINYYYIMTATVTRFTPLGRTVDSRYVYSHCLRSPRTWEHGHTYSRRRAVGVHKDARAKTSIVTETESETIDIMEPGRRRDDNGAASSSNGMQYLYH